MYGNKNTPRIVHNSLSVSVSRVSDVVPTENQHIQLTLEQLHDDWGQRYKFDSDLANHNCKSQQAQVTN